MPLADPPMPVFASPNAPHASPEYRSHIHELLLWHASASVHAMTLAANPARSPAVQAKHRAVADRHAETMRALQHLETRLPVPDPEPGLTPDPLAHALPPGTGGIPFAPAPEPAPWTHGEDSHYRPPTDDDLSA